MYTNKCILCGKEFETRHKEQALCSYEHEYICNHCGKISFGLNKDKVSRLKNEGLVFCSKQCAQIYKAKKRVKETDIKAKLNLDLLQDLYENKGYSIYQICKECNIDKKKLKYRIDLYEWTRKIPQKKINRSQMMKSYHKNLSDDEKIIRNTNLSQSIKEKWQDEYYKNSVSNTMKTVWSNRSDEENKFIRDKISKTHSQNWKNKSEEEKQQIKEKQSESHIVLNMNRTLEEKTLIAKHLSKSVKNYMNNRTENEIKNWKAKISTTQKTNWSNNGVQRTKWENKSEEEIQLINKKVHETKKLNGTYGKSSIEDKLYQYLCNEFGENNVERQHVICGDSYDFKIIRDDISPNSNGEKFEQLIELNGSFYHNFRPYIECDAHIAEYNEMKKRGGMIANIADKWRYTDTRKYQYCKANKLNFTAIYLDDRPRPYFTKQELINSYNQIKKSKNEKYTNISRYNEIVDNFCYELIYKDNLAKFKDHDIIYPYLVNRIKYANNYGKGCYIITLLKLLKDFNKAGSIFNGYTMHPINNIRKFIKDNNIKSIADPFAGWGHRLIGAYSLNCNYIGCDINNEQINNLNQILDFLNEIDINNNKYQLINEDSLNVSINNKYEAIFTCPPYYNSEIYTNKGIENLSYNEYKIKLINIFKHWYINDVKIIGIQFSNKYEDCIMELSKHLNMDLNIIPINFNKSHLNKKNKKYFECIYILKRCN